MKMWWKFTLLQAVQDVDELVSSSKFRMSLAHQLILCSEWVPSEWEFKLLLKIPHDSSPSINALWSEKLCVCKKSIIKEF